MTQRVASRRGSANGVVPLCVKEKRKAQASAANAANASPIPGRPGANGHPISGGGSSRGRGNGHKGNSSKSGRAVDGGGGGSGEMCNGSPNGVQAVRCEVGLKGSDYRVLRVQSAANKPSAVTIERSEIIRLASQYTPCAGCSVAVKGLLQRPIEELRLVNAVMEESEEPGKKGSGDRRRAKGGGNGSCGRGGDNRHQHSDRGSADESTRSASAHDGEGCTHGCSHHPDGDLHSRVSRSHHPSAIVSVLTKTVWEPSRALCLREAYLTNRARLDQLLDTFPLEGLMKKVNPKGVGLRCEIHRRNGGQSTADGREWEDAWDRLPADMRVKVAAIDVDVLEAAMHKATSTHRWHNPVRMYRGVRVETLGHAAKESARALHRFCADCKHNVVTAFDILTCKCDLADIDTEDEFLPDLFWPFAGKIGPFPGDATGQKALLSCPLEDVEELICWHEDFDSREYTRSSQRHAATLEHGQREIRSIVGSVLLSQLRTNYHNHLAQVQAEQYLFALVLHAIRAHMEGYGRDLRNGEGDTSISWGAGFGSGEPSACLHCGGAADLACQMCHGTGVSLSALEFDGDDGDKKSKTKSKKKRERKARAKAAKRSQEEEIGAGPVGELGFFSGDSGRLGEGPVGVVGCNGHGGDEIGRDHAPYTTRNSKTQRQRHKSTSTAPSVANGGRGSSGLSIAAGRLRDGSGHKAHASAGATALRTRAGSSGMESAGSLLSMLGGGAGGEGEGDEQEEESGDEGIDEDLVREMERLRIQKAQTDVQRTRAALRSNLQKNFDQLLVSSTSASRDGGGSKA